MIKEANETVTGLRDSAGPFQSSAMLDRGQAHLRRILLAIVGEGKRQLATGASCFDSRHRASSTGINFSRNCLLLWTRGTGAIFGTMDINKRRFAASLALPLKPMPLSPHRGCDLGVCVRHTAVDERGDGPTVIRLSISTRLCLPVSFHIFLKSLILDSILGTR